LLVYPASYRRERGEEIVGTLLEASPQGRTWPRVRDIRALAAGGLKARAAENRQRTAGANLRAAVMAGLAMYLALFVASYSYGAVQRFTSAALTSTGGHFPSWTGWLALAAAVLLGATVVLAWTAPRAIVLPAAVAACTAVVALGLGIGGPAAVLGIRLIQVPVLIGLALLAPRTGHPSRHWLWLPAVIAVSSAILELGAGFGWFAYWGLVSPWAPLFVLFAAGILWIGIDARLIVAMLTYFAITALQMPVIEISSGFWALSSLPFLLVVVAFAAPAVWMLRRQSAQAARQHQ
jgi:hypothetical protein